MSTSALQPMCHVRDMSAWQNEWGLHVCTFDAVTAFDLWSSGCVCSVQHAVAGDGVLVLHLGGCLVRLWLTTTSTRKSKHDTTRAIALATSATVGPTASDEVRGVQLVYQW